jgi:hypothetical protein
MQLQRKYFRLLLTGVLLLFSSHVLLAQAPVLNEEFIGPLDSWANVKTRFGARGDGKTDDTRAIQKALDSLTDERFLVNTKPANAYSVVYIPRGTYRITQQLTLSKKVGIIIVGEDPENTILQYDGAENVTILYGNGASYFRISRLQFRTVKKKNITGIGIHWHKDLTSGNSYAPQSIEISECIFRDGIARGIAGGSFTDQQQDATNSEISIRNCHFYQCSEAGIAINGYNALNYWIWNCRFYQCGNGVQNRYGNSYVYRSYFKGSTKADVFNHHGYYSSVRGCYSDSSKYFYRDDGYSCNQFKRVFEGNVIKNVMDFPIEYSDFGFITLLNNYIYKNNTDQYPFAVNIVTRNNICLADEYKIFAVGNYYEYATPYRINKKLYSQHSYTTGDYGFGKQKSNLDEKKFIASILIPFVKKAERKVFKLKPGATTAEIQAVINEASSVAWKGKRPVVHLPWGKYTIDKTIVIPAGSDLQLVGDGFMRATILYSAPNWVGQYFFHIKGPSKVVMRDIQIGRETGKDDNVYGIMIDKTDQVKAHVFIDQVRMPMTTKAMQVNKLRYTYVQKTNSYYAYRDEIIGSTAHGSNTASGSVNLFGGQYGFFNVSGNAKYFVKDTWYEGSQKEGVPFRLQGKARVVIDCARLGIYEKDTNPILEMKNFQGSFLLMNSYVDNTVLIDRKNLTGKALMMNVFLHHQPVIRNQASTTGRFNMIGVGSFGEKKTVKDIGDKAGTLELMKSMTNYTSDKLPRYFTPMPDGVTNTWFTRISFGNVRVAYKLLP